MEHLNTLNIVEKLLIAALKLEEKGTSRFSAEDLVVSAWGNFPDTFGLKGYLGKNGKLKFPDSNRVFAEIMGSKPIRKRGLLVKIGTKRYQLTESGREFAKLLINRVDKSVIEKAGISREIELQLKTLLNSRAVKKAKENRINEVTFFDACNFWNISPRSSNIEMKGRFSNFESIINSVRSVIGDKEVTFEHRGEIFSSKDLGFLGNLHQELLEKFKDQLEIIKQRKDERR